MQGSGHEMAGALEIVLRYFFSWTGLPSFTAQPPLPLQEFLPLQPLSPVLQPPLPLQEFLPAQSWTSFFLSSARTPAAATVDLSGEVAVAALSLATRPPDRMPAMAAPASSALVVDWCFICLFWFVWFCFSGFCPHRLSRIRK